ncbi:hypothetical protein SAMN04488516_10443 [Desulfonauticus submarinus]|uniref:Uncharacterized protein n=1 Tax=Desulfonauticus submarinus TaxID=206665 RepID=A0A1H0D653_9BACT|nr:DUF6340 family protein [Desulfonauticus submarinus]SDN65623.1 hypothetical protein SAMN04488516_10443 [Desulfonauticus submarinus]
MEVKNSKTILLLSLIGALFFMFSCAPKAKLTAIKPAEVAMPGVKTLAILPFKGKYGDLVREEFYSKLDEVKHFTLQDLRYNEALDRIQWEQMDDPRFVPAFEEIQADAAIAGYVVGQIRDIKGYDQVQMKEGTGRYRKVKRKNIFTGKTEIVDEEIMKTVLKRVPYIVRTASLTASIKVIDLKTRKILATKQVTESFKQKYGGKEEAQGGFLGIFGGGNSIEQVPTPEETMSLLAQKIASKLVAKIAPTKYTIEVELDKSGPSYVKKGVKLAEKGDWEGAMEMWSVVLEENPHCAPALYNLGVAYEARGDLKSLLKAKDLFVKASRYGDKDIYIEAKVRIKRKIRDAQKLRRQKHLLRKAPERKAPIGGVQVY